ncbi:hypothetical protein [Paraburkholderia tropica]|uniref:hypothetical protein n=1 Tax=Paraburkholderia tropica TaxID=92647 RepID=UPI002AB189B5|nr:hypothetical protein [Paraburkholderia tropica]
MNTSTIEDAREVRDLAKLKFAGIPGVHVVGVGLTKRDGGYAVKVNLDHAAPPGTVPPDMKLHGVPVIVEVVGTISGE